MGTYLSVLVKLLVDLLEALGQSWVVAYAFRERSRARLSYQVAHPREAIAHRPSAHVRRSGDLETKRDAPSPLAWSALGW